MVEEDDEDDDDEKVIPKTASDGRGQQKLQYLNHILEPKTDIHAHN